MARIDYSPLNYKPNSSNPIKRFKSSHSPTVDDYKNFSVGDEWLDESSDDWWKLCKKTTHDAIWCKMAGTGSAVETFIPDTGTSPVIPNATNEVTIAGGTGITTVGSLNTVTFNIDGDIAQTYTADSGSATPLLNNLNIIGTAAQGISTSGAADTITLTIADSTTTQKGVVELATLVETSLLADNTKAITPLSLAPALITKYVVDAAGGGQYITIQSAIDAANTAGGDAEIYVKPGTYIEDLTLYAGHVIRGATLETVIVGNHTPPSSGFFTFKDLFLSASSGDIFTSAVAGTAIILTENCYITIVNGYIYDLPNWAGGTLAIVSCTDASANNGVINCIGGATCLISSSFAGRGTVNTLTFSNGNIDIISTRIGCPAAIGGTATAILNEGSSLNGTLVTSDSATISISNIKISTGSLTSITHNSSNPTILTNSSINTSNSTAVGGTGAGLLTINGVNFVDSDVIAGTLTLNEDNYTHTGELVAYNTIRQTNTGFYEWDGAGPYYSVTGTTLTVTQSGTGYIKSRKITWAAGQDTGPLTKGATHYVYMDSTGTIGSTATRSTALFADNVCLFEILVDNAGTPNAIVVAENHPYTFPVEASEWAHDTIGPVIANKNNGANITLQGTKSIQIVGADELEDHGLETTIPDSGGAAENFSFMFTDGSGKWVRDSIANTFPSEYNNAGTVTALGSNKYGVFRLYVSKSDINSSTPTYYAVYNTSQYNNLTAAQTAIASGNIAGKSAELAQLELAQLGYVIKEESSDTIVDVIIEKETVKGDISIAIAGNASLVLTDTSNFNGWLSASDTTVQSALDTLDDVGLNVTPEHSILLAGSGYDISSTGVLTNGQLVIGNTGNAPSVSTLTAGTGITITNAAGSITIDGTGGGVSWTEVTGTTQAIAVNNGYIANNGALVTLTLPTTASIGDVIKLVGKGAGLYKIAQNAGQTIHYGSSDTTTGTGGSLTATNQYDAIKIVCITSNTDFAVLSSTGSFTVV